MTDDDNTALHEEIEQARTDLAADVTALLGKTDVKATVRRRLAAAGRKVLRRPARKPAAITATSTDTSAD